MGWSKRAAARAAVFVVRALRGLGWLTVIGAAVAGAMLLGVRFWVWPEVDRFRPELEQWVSEQLGVRVQLRELRGEWEGLAPRLVVEEWQVKGEGGEMTAQGRLVGVWIWPWGGRVRIEGEAPGWGIGRFRGEGEGRWPFWRVQGEGWGIDGRGKGAVWAKWVQRLIGWEEGGERELAVRAEEVEWQVDGVAKGVSFFEVQVKGGQIAATGAPEVEGLKGRVWGNSREGRFELSGKGSRWIWPAGWLGVQEMHFSELQGKGGWRWSATEGWTVEGEEVYARTADWGVTARGRVEGIGSREGVRVAWEGRLWEVNLTRLADFLPRGMVGMDTIAWVQQAFLGGRVREAPFRVVGPWRAFPFAGGEGQLEVTIPVQEVALRFAPGWPVVRMREGMVQFVGPQLRVEVARAESEGVQFRHISAWSPNVEAEVPVLAVVGEAAGGFATVVRYLEQSPMASRLPLAEWRRWRVRGEVTVRLGLSVPLAGTGAVGVAGEAVLQGGSIPAEVAGKGVRGLTVKARFDQGGLVGGRGSGVWGDMPITAEVMSMTPLRVGFTARVPAKAAVEALGLGEKHLQGEGTVRGEVEWEEGGRRWRMTSDLRGVAVRLPEPLRKEAEEGWTLEGRGAVRGEVSEGEVWIRDRIAAKWQGSAWGVAVGRDTAPKPRREGVIAVRAEELDGDAWRAAINEMAVRGGVPEVRVEAKRLRFANRWWHEVIWVLQPRGEGGGKFTVRAREIEGEGEVVVSKGEVERVTLELRRLVWPQGEGERIKTRRVGEGLERWPTVVARVEELEVEGRRVGQLRLVGAPTERGWRVREWSLALPGRYRLEGGASWTTVEGERYSVLQANTAFEAFGESVAELLATPGMRGGRGTLTVELEWKGGFEDFELARASGQGRIALREGVFEEIEPGVGRLISVFNLQMLLRRLRFDFSDVLGRGLTYDRLSGSFALANGFVSTADLTIDAPAALVQLAGTVDLQRRTQDLEARVVPRLGETAATALTLVNPLAGVVTFLTQQVIGDPLGGILVQRYRLQGGWEGPAVRQEGKSSSSSREAGDENR
ncbi:MAG: DUF3971 domain-containing protein [Hydrogenophilus sp.]|nr:DUF3971 domain-containing protein [Hydrogenophilus sp.]